MPSKSPEQAALMRAAAHGWKKPGGGGPSQAVGREYMNADRGYEEGGPVEGMTFKQMLRSMGGGSFDLGNIFKLMQGIEDGTYYKDSDGLIYSNQPTILGDQGDSGPYPSLTPMIRPNGVTAPPTEPVEPVAQGPGNRGGRGPGGGGRGNRGGGGRGGRGGGGRGGGGGGNTPPRIIPPGIDPTTGVPPVDGGDDAPPYVAPAAGRESEYSIALAAHNDRIKNIFGSAEGGAVGYEEGGVVRPGHAEEKPNPYDIEQQPALHNMWERKYHVDPPPPPPPPPEPEELGWLDILMGKKTASETRTERELEEMEQARGGHVRGYAGGGLAAAMGPVGMRGPQRMQPGKPMPPQGAGGVRGMMNQIRGQRGDPRSMPPQGGGGKGGIRAMMQRMQQQRQGQGGGGFDPRRSGPKLDPRSMPPQQPPGMDPRMSGPKYGGPSRTMPTMPPRGGMPPGRGMPRRGMGVPPIGGGGTGEPPQIEGGPQIPSNMQGQLQTMRMRNRPRRGFSGPAGAGGPGGGGNRVGMQDQQGGLARALQRGTGRPPTSRRSGFPGR